MTLAITYGTLAIGGVLYETIFGGLRSKRMLRNF